MEKIPSDKEMLEMLECVADQLEATNERLQDTADRLHRTARRLNRNVNDIVSRPKGGDTL